MSIKRFVAAVSIASILLMPLVISLDAGASAEFVGATLCLTLIGLLSHGSAYRTSTNAATGSVAFIPFLAAIVLAPSWVAVVGVACAAALAELHAQRAPLKAAFNVAQFTLAVGLAVVAFRLLGGVSPLNTERLVASQLPAYGVSFLIFLGANSLLVCKAIAIVERRPLSEVLQKRIGSTLVYDIVALPFAYGYARFYADYGAGWTFALAIPLMGVRQLYRTNWQLERTNQELLQLMVKAIEARDPYTSGHSRRVAEYASIIARAVGIKPKLVERISMAALLHDVGKIHEDFAPILRKPSALSSDERSIMESHSERGAQLVATVSQLEDLVPIIRHHHERWDGTGYPARLSTDSIPLGARIIMLADTIDAMTSDRPYRAALGEREVVAELTRMSGRQFDPHLCSAFLHSGAQISLFDAVRRARANAIALADQVVSSRGAVALTA